MMQKKAFTLLELLIVVVMMGVVYALVFFIPSANLSSSIRLKDDFRTRLKPYASKSPAELICYDDCRRCAIFSNRQKIAEIPNTFFSSQAKTYRFDAMGEFKPIRYNDQLIDEKFQNVCFSFTLYPNGSSTQLFLKNERNITYFPSYFGIKREFSTVEEAKNSVYALPTYPTSVDSYYYQE